MSASHMIAMPGARQALAVAIRTRWGRTACLDQLKEYIAASAANMELFQAYEGLSVDERRKVLKALEIEQDADAEDEDEDDDEEASARRIATILWARATASPGSKYVVVCGSDGQGCGLVKVYVNAAGQVDHKKGGALQEKLAQLVRHVVLDEFGDGDGIALVFEDVTRTSAKRRVLEVAAQWRFSGGYGCDPEDTDEDLVWPAEMRGTALRNIVMAAAPLNCEVIMPAAAAEEDDYSDEDEDEDNDDEQQ